MPVSDQRVIFYPASDIPRIPPGGQQLMNETDLMLPSQEPFRKYVHMSRMTFHYLCDYLDLNGHRQKQLNAMSMEVEQHDAKELLYP